MASRKANFAKERAKQRRVRKSWVEWVRRHDPHSAFPDEREYLELWEPRRTPMRDRAATQVVDNWRIRKRLRRLSTYAGV